MGTTKSEHYTEAQNRISTMIKALGHPARIRIIEHLVEVKSCICGDIVTEMPLAQPTVSQHLKELKNAGIIKGSIEGNTICYCIDNEALLLLKNYFNDICLKTTTQKCC